MLALDHAPKSYHLILVDLVHTIQIQIEYLSKVCYVPNNEVSEPCSADTTYSYSMLYISTLNPILK
jgi:hypothetical protein